MCRTHILLHAALTEQAVEDRYAALSTFLYCKLWRRSVLHYRYFFHRTQWKNSVLHYLYLYLQVVEEKWAALAVILHSKQWRRSKLHYRYFYTVSSGEGDSCMHVKNGILRHFCLWQNTSRIAAHGSHLSGTTNCCLPEASKSALDPLHRHCDKLPLPLVV